MRRVLTICLTTRIGDAETTDNAIPHGYRHFLTSDYCYQRPLAHFSSPETKTNMAAASLDDETTRVNKARAAPIHAPPRLSRAAGWEANIIQCWCFQTLFFMFAHRACCDAMRSFCFRCWHLLFSFDCCLNNKIKFHFLIFFCDCL